MRIGNVDLTEDEFYGRSQIKGSLDLDDLTSIPNGFNPSITGNLYLRNVTSIPKGFNPIVGMSLYLTGLTSRPRCFNPKVGGIIFFNETWEHSNENLHESVQMRTCKCCNDPLYEHEIDFCIECAVTSELDYLSLIHI